MPNSLRIDGSIFLLAAALSLTSASGETVSAHGVVPILAGRAPEYFAVGECLHAETFADPGSWLVQVEPVESATTPRIRFEDGVFDLYMPERGCTAWLKQRFAGPVAIIYEVRCPVETLEDPGIQARDLNNFWHATDPLAEDGLFDPKRYTGRFTTYHKLHGYYASTGGGGRVGNRTIRFRRYPRSNPEGEPLPHIALTEQDGRQDLLIVPGRWHHVQLVIAGGFVQYIFDGKLVYEMAPGDEVTVEHPDGSLTRERYTLERFPAYDSGYFGFRMVRSHHQYRHLRIYRLRPVRAPAS